MTGSCVAASRNSGIIASGGSNFKRDEFRNEVVIWSSDTGDMMKRFKGHKRRIDCIDISDDGRWVVSGDRENRFIVWDVEKSKRVVEIVDKERYRPTWVVFPNDNKDSRIVTASIPKCRHYSILSDYECDSEQFEPCWSCRGEEVRICMWNSRTGDQCHTKVIKAKHRELSIDVNQLMPFLAVSRDARFVAFCENDASDMELQFGVWDIEGHKSFRETRQWRKSDRFGTHYQNLICKSFERLGSKLGCEFSKMLINVTTLDDKLTHFKVPENDKKYTMQSSNNKIEVVYEPKSSSTSTPEQRQIAKAKVSGGNVRNATACFIPSENGIPKRAASACSSGPQLETEIGTNIWEFIPAKCTRPDDEWL